MKISVYWKLQDCFRISYTNYRYLMSYHWLQPSNHCLVSSFLIHHRTSEGTKGLPVPLQRLSNTTVTDSNVENHDHKNADKTDISIPSPSLAPWPSPAHASVPAQLIQLTHCSVALDDEAVSRQTALCGRNPTETTNYISKSLQKSFPSHVDPWGGANLHCCSHQPDTSVH